VGTKRNSVIRKKNKQFKQLLTSRDLT